MIGSRNSLSLMLFRHRRSRNMKIFNFFSIASSREKVSIYTMAVVVLHRESLSFDIINNESIHLFIYIYIYIS